MTCSLSCFLMLIIIIIFFLPSAAFISRNGSKTSCSQRRNSSKSTSRAVAKHKSPNSSSSFSSSYRYSFLTPPTTTTTFSFCKLRCSLFFSAYINFCCSDGNRMTYLHKCVWKRVFCQRRASFAVLRMSRLRYSKRRRKWISRYAGLLLIPTSVPNLYIYLCTLINTMSFSLFLYVCACCCTIFELSSLNLSLDNCWKI